MLEQKQVEYLKDNHPPFCFGEEKKNHNQEERRTFEEMKSSLRHKPIYL